MTAHVTSQARSRKVLDVFLTVIGELLLTAGVVDWFIPGVAAVVDVD